jgi:hypothetical protein
MAAISILSEDRLSIEEARLLLGTGGKPCDYSRVYRAIMEGDLLPNGQRHRLEAARFGRRWVTSKQAIERFVEAMTTAWIDDAGAPLVRPSARRAKELADVNAQLDSIGI